MNRNDIKVGDRLVVTEDHSAENGAGRTHTAGDVVTARGWADGVHPRDPHTAYYVAVNEQNEGYADARYLAPDDGRVVGEPMHNHGAESGEGTRCVELRQDDGSLIGRCRVVAVDDDTRPDLPDAGDDGMGGALTPGQSYGLGYAENMAEAGVTDCPCIDAPGRIPLDAVQAAAALLGGPGRDLPVDAVIALAASLDASERVSAEVAPSPWDAGLELTADGDEPEARIDVRQRHGARLLVATNEGVDLDDVREAAAGHRMLLDAMTERGAR